MLLNNLELPYIKTFDDSDNSLNEIRSFSSSKEEEIRDKEYKLFDLSNERIIIDLEENDQDNFNHDFFINIFKKEKSLFHEKKGKNIKFQIKNENIKNIFKLNISQRGPKKKKLTNKRKHSKYAKENVNIKLKICVDNCIIYYINEILKNLEIKIPKNYKSSKRLEFLKISHQERIKAINKFVNSLNDKNLGDIIKGKVSTKYGKKNKNNKDKVITKDDENDKSPNIILFKELEKNEDMKKIFSESYFHFFKNIFFKSEREIKVKINQSKNILIKFPEKIKLFNDLLKTDDIKYQKIMRYCAYKYFMPGSIFMIN